jgi:penicillin-binding protein 2
LGKAGLEKIYEKYLRGEKGIRYLEVDAHGFEQRRMKGLEPLPGSDLYLTLDIDLQKVAEESLAGKAGAVVAMEVNSGRLLVLASSPPLAQEQFIGGISHKEWQALLDDPLFPLVDKSIQGQYPPGSTYKVVTALAGLAEKVITPETVYYCAGSFFFGGRRYGCWKRGGHGAVDLHRALTESCDVYFYQVGLDLGVDRMARYAFSLGLGAVTGIELEHEKPGLVPTSEWKKKHRQESWQKGETLSTAIGQGFNLTTPIQIARMMAAVANGGVLYRPLLVDAVIDQEGHEVARFAPQEEGRVLGTARALALIREGLVSAVNDRHGTGRAARLEKITVAGKTGTAQVVRLEQYKGLGEDKIPYKYRDHAWFMCFAPAEKPEIAVAVLVEHGLHGGSGAGPVAKAILARYFADALDEADLKAMEMDADFEGD